MSSRNKYRSTRSIVTGPDHRADRGDFCQNQQFAPHWNRHRHVFKVQSRWYPFIGRPPSTSVSSSSPTITLTEYISFAEASLNFSTRTERRPGLNLIKSSDSKSRSISSLDMFSKPTVEKKNVIIEI